MWGAGPGGGMVGYGGGWGGAGSMLMSGGVFWLLLLLLLIAAVAWALPARLRQPPSTDAGKPTALEIVEQRYARGEIDRDEYLQKQHDLQVHRIA